jgi:YVTN family beta-propeller protein
MNMNSRYYVLSIFLLLGIFSPLLLGQNSNYKITGNIDIGGGKRWDYLAIDTVSNRLYVTHASEVNVIDLDKNTLVGTIPDLNGVHGVAFAYEFGKGYITNGMNNTVTVFDLKTLKVLDSIKLDGKGPDAIAYDTYSKRIFTFNGKSDNSTAIDAKTDKVVGNVALDGGPEFAVSDGNGKMYVNLEDKNSIQQFDPQSLKVTAKWPIDPGEGPSGLAIDREHNILFSGCHNQLMVVVNAETGKVITTLPIGKRIDACKFDPSDGLAFSSNGEGTITVVKEDSPDKFEVIDNITTQPGARTMAVDLITHRIYTVTMIDGKSFGVLILDRK